MKLITKEIEKLMEKYPLRSQDGKDIKENVVIAKFFGGSCCTWYALEGSRMDNGDIEFFGYVNLGYGAELGYFYLSELENLRFPPFGLGIERDSWFNNGKTKVKELDLELM